MDDVHSQGGKRTEVFGGLGYEICIEREYDTTDRFIVDCEIKVGNRTFWGGGHGKEKKNKTRLRKLAQKCSNTVDNLVRP